MVSREDLIISKLEWAKTGFSDLQLRDVKNLSASGYDAEYLNKWIRELGLIDIWRKAIS
jgi:hypothetical protein